MLCRLIPLDAPGQVQVKSAIIDPSVPLMSQLLHLSIQISEKQKFFVLLQCKKSHQIDPNASLLSQLLVKQFTDPLPIYITEQIPLSDQFPDQKKYIQLASKIQSPLLPKNTSFNDEKEIKKPKSHRQQLALCQPSKSNYGSPIFSKTQIPYMHLQNNIIFPFHIIPSTKIEQISYLIQLPQAVETEVLKGFKDTQVAFVLQLKSAFSNPKVNPTMFEALIFLTHMNTCAVAYASVSTSPVNVKITQSLPLLLSFQTTYDETQDTCQIQNEFGMFWFHTDRAGCEQTRAVLALVINLQQIKSAKSLIFGLMNSSMIRPEKYQKPLIQRVEKPEQQEAQQQEDDQQVQPKQEEEENGMIPFFKFFRLNAHQFVRAMKLGESEGFGPEVLQKQQPDQQTDEVFYQFFNELQKAILDITQEQQQQFNAFLISQIQKESEQQAALAAAFAVLAAKAGIFNALQNKLEVPTAQLELVTSLQTGSTVLEWKPLNNWLKHTCAQIVYCYQLIQCENLTFVGQSSRQQTPQNSIQKVCIMQQNNLEQVTVQLSELGIALMNAAQEEIQYRIVKMIIQQVVSYEMLINEQSLLIVKQFKQQYADSIIVYNSVSDGKYTASVVSNSDTQVYAYVCLYNTFLCQGDEYITTHQDSLPLKQIHFANADEKIQVLWQYYLYCANLLQHDVPDVVRQMQVVDLQFKKQFGEQNSKFLNFIPMLFNKKRIILLTNCFQEQLLSQTMRPRNAMKLSQFLETYPDFEPLQQLMSVWKAEHCVSFTGQVSTLPIAQYISPQQIISQLCVPVIRTGSLNTIIHCALHSATFIRLLNFSDKQITFLKQKYAIFTQSQVDRFEEAQRNIEYEIPERIKAGGMRQTTTSQHIAGQVYCELLTAALFHKDVEQQEEKIKQKQALEVKQCLAQLVNKVVTEDARRHLKEELGKEYQKFLDQVRKEEQLADEKMNTSLQSMQQRMKQCFQSTIKGDLANTPYQKFQSILLLLSTRFNTLARIGQEMQSSFSQCQLLNVDGVLPFQALLNVIPMEQMAENKIDYQILLQDGEYKIESKAAIHIKPGLFTLNEKKQYFEKFVQLILETETNIDILEHKYQWGTIQFQKLASATNCLVGYLGYYFATHDSKVLLEISSFNFDTSISLIRDHPLCDFYCYIKYCTELPYQLYQRKWDCLLAVQQLKLKLEENKAISDMALQILFRNTYNIDLLQFSVNQTDSLALLFRVAPHLKTISLKNLNFKTTQLVKMFQQLEAVYVADINSSQGWVDVLTVRVLKLGE